MIRPMQKLNRYERMGIRAVLRNRHDKEYYRTIVANATEERPGDGFILQLLS